MNPHMVRIAIVIDIINMRIIIELDKIGEFGESGFFDSIFLSAGSKPSGITIHESVTKLTHKICTGTSGTGIPAASENHFPSVSGE